ncbi:hypothetical protein EON81_05890 [bacterium]|nr:MAG: hypothetical protein EON81_05890 [bacterium]
MSPSFLQAKTELIGGGAVGLGRTTKLGHELIGQNANLLHEVILEKGPSCLSGGNFDRMGETRLPLALLYLCHDAWDAEGLKRVQPD